MSAEAGYRAEIDNPGGMGRLTQLSRSDRPTLHSYFDLCPWSRDERWIVLARLTPEPRTADILALADDSSTQIVVGRSSTATPHAGAFQQWIPGSDEIAFEDRIGSSDIVRAVSATGEVDRTLHGRLRMFSPDGARAASHSDARRTAGDDRETTGVFVTDLSTDQSRLVVSVADMLRAADQPADLPLTLGPKHTKWSPDGRHLFFVLSNEFGAGEPRFKMLFVSRADGTGVTPLLEDPRWGHPSWHPAGGKVLVNAASPTTGARELTVLDVATGSRTVVTDRIAGTGHPSFDPTGRRIAIELMTPEEAPSGPVEIYILDTDTDSLALAARRISRNHTHTGTHEHPTWSRTGSRLLFNSDETGHSEVYQLELEA